MALADIRYLPTITNPDKILCVGLNYKAHQEETGRGGEGIADHLRSFAGAQMGHEAPMVRPTESATLDFEGEIAMIIGKGGRRIARPTRSIHVVASASTTMAACGSISARHRSSRRVRTSLPPAVSGPG